MSKNEKELVRLAESLTVDLPEQMETFQDYSSIHLNCSGGKDSIALALLLIYGYKIPLHKMTLVHFRVDGSEEENPIPFFDYPETDGYLRKVAEQLNLPLEIISSPKGLKERIEERGKFPSAATQYCTSYQKRDTYSKWVRRQGPGHFLCVSGERAQESPRRRNKPVYEVYKAANAPTKNRFVSWWRAIHHLLEEDVWQLLELAGIEPHPAYTTYGVSRCSCKFCIFLSPKEMKKVAESFPEEFQELEKMEKRLNHTMKFDKEGPVTIREFIKKADEKPEQFKLDLFRPCSFL